MLTYCSTLRLKAPVRLIRWRSPFGPAFGCYSRWSLVLALTQEIFIELLPGEYLF